MNENEEFDSKNNTNDNSFKQYVIENTCAYRIVFWFALALLILLNTVCFFGVIPSSSMEPTINTGDRVYVNRLSYSKSSPQRKDIIAFKSPDSTNKILVKRCIGLPGDTLEIKSGQVYINGSVLDEPFLAEDYKGVFGPYYVPKAGDTVDYNGVNCYINDVYVGKADFINTYCEKINGQYIVKNDCYFMLGDNVNNSLDARYWKNKYITNEDNIIGKVIFRFFPNLNKIQ
ncbi:MAG: signal peptidase I [Eubacterium sp.]|nr:signal peptidase I [Eubacterium sp.]